MMRRGLSVALLAAWLPVAALLAPAAQAFAPPVPTVPAEPIGDPVPGKPLRDRDFGVVARKFGLDREVEMYQWRASGTGYERVWNAAPIDSSGFAPGHENPAAIPLDSRRWWSDTATLDSKPLAREVLQALGEWRGFRPNFSRLPSNLAASFQPEGDGLGSAENPLDPQIGDLRVRWRELHLPPLAGQVEWREGAWRLKPDAPPLNREPAEAEDAAPAPKLAIKSRTGLWLLGGLVVAGLGAMLIRRRGRRSGKG